MSVHARLGVVVRNQAEDILEGLAVFALLVAIFDHQHLAVGDGLLNQFTVSTTVVGGGDRSAIDRSAVGRGGGVVKVIGVIAIPSFHGRVCRFTHLLFSVPLHHLAFAIFVSAIVVAFFLAAVVVSRLRPRSFHPRILTAIRMHTVAAMVVKVQVSLPENIGRVDFDRAGWLGIGSWSAGAVELSVSPDHFDILATFQPKDDVRVVFENVWVVGIHVLERFVDVALQNSSSDLYAEKGRSVTNQFIPRGWPFS